MTSFTPGAPCWADLWTSDVQASRSFYSRLLGWEAGEADPTHGGYFMFLRDGAPVAGGMGPTPDMPADNTWKPYLTAPDLDSTLDRVTAAGGRILAPAAPVDSLGTPAVVADPAGAAFGLWQPGEFAGFAIIGAEGAPSWFELQTTDHAGAVAFYRDALGLELVPMSDTDDFRYWTFRSPGTETDLGGIMDAGAWLPAGGSAWSIYWEVADLDAALDRVKDLGGTIERGPDDTPWGRLAVAADPVGASFKLRSSPR